LNYIVEIVLSIFLILFIISEIIKIYIFRNDKNILITVLISLILFGFGLYLLIKYGLILDYGKIDEIINTKAEIMHNIAISDILTGFFSVLLFVIEIVVWKIKKIIK
jgi:hypothetical protein